MAIEASAPEGGPPGRPATIYTVAEAAGVSHQTVSRYLKGDSLRPGNRERVEQAVKALDYQVNDVAQALSTKKSHRIGAFVFDIDDWAPQRILAGAAKAARSAGYILDILRVDPEDNVSLRNASRLINRTMLAGVVVISPSDPILRLLQLYVLQEGPVGRGGRARPGPGRRPRPPTPLAGREPPRRPGPRTLLPHRGPGLLAGGTEPPRGLPADARPPGPDELRRDPGAVGRCRPRRGHGVLPPRHAPIGASSDQLALGALFWLQEHGVRVPDDVSVSGYDGISDTAYYWPPLTTVAVYFPRMGRNTVQALLALEGGGGPPDLGMPVGELVPRASTGRPGGGIPAP
ncbi:LacI family DNA-binding transcriptional regulator [Propioniciclava flava]